MKKNKELSFQDLILSEMKEKDTSSENEVEEDDSLTDEDISVLIDGMIGNVPDTSFLEDRDLDISQLFSTPKRKR
jgi:uncharacterized protein YacL